MKSIASMLLLSLSLAGVFVVAGGPINPAWVEALDARPEALATGTTLLLLASILRRGSAQPRVK
jgi:hypothetical protein